MFCDCLMLWITFGHAIVFLGGQEDVPSLEDLATAIRSELDQEIADDQTEERCAALLHYSMLDSYAVPLTPTSNEEDIILESGRIIIDITRSYWDVGQLSSQKPESIHAAALALLEKNEFSDVLLLIKTDVLTTFQRSNVLAKLSEISLTERQEDIARDAVIALRMHLEANTVYGVDYDERICLHAMIASASLGDKLNCRWFCDRLSSANRNVDLLTDFHTIDLSELVLTETAFHVLVQVLKDLKAGDLREQLCTFLLFHDRNGPINKEVERVLWLQSEPNVKCASICRKAFLGLQLTKDDTDFLTAEPGRLRTAVNWISRYSIARGNQRLPAESVRLLRIIAENSFPERSPALWFIRSRLAAISAETDPKSSRECLNAWNEAIAQGAKSDLVATSATHMMRVAIALSDVDALRQIVATWREKRVEMDYIERQVCDAETLRVLQASPNTLVIGEIPADICIAFPFSVGMIRPKDFQAARTALHTPRERFWFTAGYLSIILKEEGLITPFVVDCCTAPKTGDGD